MASGSHNETLSEVADDHAPALARLLVRVLSYDDLLGPAGQVLHLDDQRWPLRLGRGDGGAPLSVAADTIRVADRWMSSAHAALVQKGDAVFLVDDHSRNGTWVDGQRTQERELADGDLIEVGHTLLCYRAVDRRAAAALRSGAGPLDLGPTTTANAEMATLRADLERVAAGHEPVLALGETGAGKEMIAEVVHRRSGRRGPLVSVDCGAIPESLFESTFFGHRRGAYTGALEARVGEISRADQGTLFLDEVGNLSPQGQAKLLRVIEEGAVTPVGGDKGHRVDVRWVAATNRELATDPGFRADLYRRLAGFVARTQPLRRRREDLGTLGAYLLGQAGITRAAISAVAARRIYPGRWPGNIRELRAVLRGAATLAGDEPIGLGHLARARGAPESDEAAGPSEPAATVGLGAAGADRQRSPSADEVRAALRATSGNVARAATRLQTTPRQLYRWLERFGIDADDFRTG
jgi:DNA-binding NtrC family response regulator